MAVRSLTVMWDGSLVVAANNNGTCYVWRLQRGTHCLLSPGQIARATTISESTRLVVIFDNNSGSDYDLSGSQFLIRILKYLETAQYLRRALFHMHTSLRIVGLLLPLDAPHHLHKHKWVHIGKVSVTQKERGPNNTGTQFDVGLTKNIVVDQNFESGIRVTIAMGTDHCLETYSLRKVVPSSTPREEGSYWGYKVRYAPNISFVFKDCPFEGGYDQKIGTSEHGVLTTAHVFIEKEILNPKIVNQDSFISVVCCFSVNYLLL
ncbi:hypothetical protein MKW92_019762 [Papaver armeniacum]|nr:hypothetical protein MKW92_019762 [Papaver armeniacum]